MASQGQNHLQIFGHSWSAQHFSAPGKVSAPSVIASGKRSALSNLTLSLQWLPHEQYENMETARAVFGSTLRVAQYFFTNSSGLLRTQKLGSLLLATQTYSGLCCCVCVTSFER